VTLSVGQAGAVRGIEQICAEEADSRVLRRRVAERLSRVMYWDWACFGTTDPWTMLVTDDVSFGLSPQLYALAAHNEYLVDDVNKFVTLARSGTGVGILSRVPAELRRTSRRLRTVLPKFGARHEVRAACLADGQCWGAIALFRTGDQPDFSSADASLLQAVSAPLAAGLRRTAYRLGAGVGITAGKAGPGVLVLGPADETLMANEAAHQYLDELVPAARRPGGGLPLAVHQVAARTRARLPGADDRGWFPDAYARIRARSGRWLTLHGSAVADGGGADRGVAVVLEAAPASDIAELLMLVYGLTRRERQVLQRVIAGASSAVIGTELHISVHTVQDHLKSIFAKVGVRSRGQLVAKLLGEHYLPPAPTL
jgi:DNA-binding CsgD family transcriptional regulator